MCIPSIGPTKESSIRDTNIHDGVFLLTHNPCWIYIYVSQPGHQHRPETTMTSSSPATLNAHASSPKHAPRHRSDDPDQRQAAQRRTQSTPQESQPWESTPGCTSKHHISPRAFSRENRAAGKVDVALRRKELPY